MAPAAIQHDRGGETLRQYVDNKYKASGGSVVQRQGHWNSPGFIVVVVFHLSQVKTTVYGLDPRSCSTLAAAVAEAFKSMCKFFLFCIGFAETQKGQWIVKRFVRIEIACSPTIHRLMGGNLLCRDVSRFDAIRFSLHLIRVFSTPQISNVEFYDELPVGGWWCLGPRAPKIEIPIGMSF